MLANVDTPVAKIVAAMPLRDLALCGKDLLSLRENAAGDGALRALVVAHQHATGCDETVALGQVEAAVLREIATRFVAATERSADVLAPKPLHPEQLAGEMHLCNLEPEGARVVGWSTKRIGERAYRDDGSIDPAKVAVFISAEQFKAAGLWDPRYTVKA